MIETAMVLPLLMLLLGVIVDAGLALNAWLRVNTAARDATRFALDAGRPNDTVTLVLDKLKGLETDPIDVYIITGQTDNTGIIADDNAPYWDAVHRYGTRTGGPGLTLSEVQSRLVVAGNPGADDTVLFVAVEVDLNYTPLIGQLIAPNLKLPMSSYALVQRPPK